MGEAYSIGEFIRAWREQRHITSRGLSKMLGKSPAYISQIERGLIKNPDYQTCKTILEMLDFEEDRIERILSYYDINSPTEKLEVVTQNLNNMLNDYEFAKLELRQSIKQIMDNLNTLLDKDFTVAQQVIPYLHGMTSSRDNITYLCNEKGRVNETQIEQ